MTKMGHGGQPSEQVGRNCRRVIRPVNRIEHWEFFGIMEHGCILEEQEKVHQVNHFVNHRIVASSLGNRLVNVTGG
jgi:hypothetical protein